MHRRLLFATSVALVLAAFLVAGCTAQPSGAPEEGSTPAVPPGSTTATPGASPAGSAPVSVRITTEQGAIELELYPAKAPQTVANFVKLAESGFFDGIRVHRVEPGFVVQAGDPQTKTLSKSRLRSLVERQKSGALRPDDPPIGTGGPGWTIPLEISDLVHDRGVIAMARSQDPNSGGSQFYITLQAVHQLDGGYAVFGRVVEGMDVVERLSVGDEIRSVRVGD